MTDKTTHFGRAGEYFAMSELLLRGWNVAVPVVDVGDDVFVIDDSDKKTRRLQVKTSTMDPVSGYQSLGPQAGGQGGPGRRPLDDEAASTDRLLLQVELKGDEVTGWNTWLNAFFERWPDALPIVVGGPGSVRQE